VNRLIWSLPGRRDLVRYLDWLQHRDTAATLRIATAIDERAKWLAEYPRAGQVIEGTDTRSFRVLRTRYVIVYRVVGETVEIVRVHNGAEDWRPR
jgi:plasmid stabilization system protein ParE